MAGSSQIPKTPASNAPPSLKKSTSGSQSGQKSIASFFSKRAVEGQYAKVSVPSTLPAASQLVNGVNKKALFAKPARGSSQSLTPAPSSDAVEREDSEEPTLKTEKDPVGNGLPSPITPASGVASEQPSSKGIDLPLMFDSPSRKVSDTVLCL